MDYTEYGLYVIVLSIIFVKNARKKLRNYNESKPEILRLLWDIIVFRLVAYLLNMICLIIQLLYKIAYKFDTVLYQFLETGTSDRCLKCIVQNLRFSSFILYPLSIFLYSPFNTWNCRLNIKQARNYNNVLREFR